MAKKRITMADLLRLDIIRNVEMAVDGVVQGGAAIQFWNDVFLYGLEEAICYLKRYAKVPTIPELDELVVKIKAKTAVTK